MASKSVSELAQRLIPAAQHKYAALLQKQRDVLWADTGFVFRLRKYPKSKTERVSLVTPNFHDVSMFSEALRQKVTLTMTRRMLRHVEEAGGLDAYLLSTPNAALNSSAASALKWRISCALKQREHAAWAAAAKQGVQGAPAASTGTLSSS